MPDRGGTCLSWRDFRLSEQFPRALSGTDWSWAVWARPHLDRECLAAHIYLQLNLLDLAEGEEGCHWISLFLFPVWSCWINPLFLIFPALYFFIWDIEDGWPSLVSLRLQDSGFEPNSSNSIPASCLDIQNASAAFGFMPCLNLPLLPHDWDQLCPSSFVIWFPSSRVSMTSPDCSCHLPSSSLFNVSVSFTPVLSWYWRMPSSF